MIDCDLWWRIFIEESDFMNYMYSFCHVRLFFTQVKVRKVIDLLHAGIIQNCSEKELSIVSGEHEA